MRWLIITVSLTLNLLAVASWSQERHDRVRGITPQARPIVNLLKAVKDRDQKKLKTVFSERMRRALDEEGWDKVLKSYHESFETAFGNYKLEHFDFEYVGGEQDGKVSVVHEGKKLPGLRVIKERINWKLDER